MMMEQKDSVLQRQELPYLKEAQHFPGEIALQLTYENNKYSSRYSIIPLHLLECILISNVYCGYFLLLQLRQVRHYIPTGQHVW